MLGAQYDGLISSYPALAFRAISLTFAGILMPHRDM